MEQFQNKSAVFTNEEIDSLIKKDRIILIYDNQVLDMTGYKHPGGDNFFQDNIKKDIKQLFDD
jgi:cytochrome b involved in lipid metabolism